MKSRLHRQHAIPDSIVTVRITRANSPSRVSFLAAASVCATAVEENLLMTHEIQR